LDQEIITLNEEQIKAFKSMERAFKKCQEANVMFYTVLETLHFINGDKVACIDTDESGMDGPRVDDILDTSYSLIDSGLAGFADDTHYVELKK